MEVRALRREEAAAHTRMMQYAFGRYVSEEPGEKELARKPVNQILAAFDGSVLASCMTIHDFIQSIRGVRKRMAGIGGVATAPEYRGRGLMRRLLTEGFALMRDTGQSVSMLRPFRERFYERYGYVRTNGAMDYTISCRSFDQFASCDSGHTLVTLSAEQAQERYLSAVGGPLGSVHGRVVHEELAPESWSHRFKDRLFAFVMRGDEPVAVASYSKEGFMAEGVLGMRELAWADAAAREALFSFIALHRDQISRVTLTLPYDTNIHALIPAIEDAVVVQYHSAPWMVRIIDVRTALEGVPVTESIDLAVEVADRVCSWNNGTVRVQTRQGALSLAPTAGPPDLSLSIEALSALLYGALPASQIARELAPRASATASWTHLTRALVPCTVFNDYWF
jgi:predicted acetyltransferase